jgi:hypothetical protein
MATSSILGGERPPIEPKGTDEDSLGPSDSSDSGSDAAGTGNRAAAEGGLEEPTDSDILPDRVGVSPDAAHAVDTAADDPDAARVEDLAEEDGDDGEPENA